MALYNRNPPPGCIHHSDRGVQYASGDYVKELKAHGFQISMGRKANPYDNAYAESFIKTLKSEEVQLWEYLPLRMLKKGFPTSLSKCIIKNDYTPLLAIGLLVSLKP